MRGYDEDKVAERIDAMVGAIGGFKEERGF
jgi:hypothetical protein